MDGITSFNYYQVVIITNQLFRYRMEALVVFVILIVFIFLVNLIFGGKQPPSDNGSSEYFKTSSHASSSYSGDDISVISLPEARILARSFNVGGRYLIEYTDSSGNDSQREITVRSVDGITIKAVCHRRRSLRTFKADRMSLVIDTETGEALL